MNYWWTFDELLMTNKIEMNIDWANISNKNLSNEVIIQSEILLNRFSMREQLFRVENNL